MAYGDVLESAADYEVHYQRLTDHLAHCEQRDEPKRRAARRDQTSGLQKKTLNGTRRYGSSRRKMAMYFQCIFNVFAFLIFFHVLKNMYFQWFFNVFSMFYFFIFLNDKKNNVFSMYF